VEEAEGMQPPRGQTPHSATFLDSWKAVFKSPLLLYPCAQVRETSKYFGLPAAGLWSGSDALYDHGFYGGCWL